MNRRNFLVTTGSGIIGSCFLPFSLRAEELKLSNSSAGKARSVIYLNISGGMSHLDSFDIKPENKDVCGEAGALKTSADGLRVSKFFPHLAKQMHHVAVINSLTTSQGAHEEGQYFMQSSYIKRGIIEHPHLGAWVSKFLPSMSQNLPSYVKINKHSGSLGAGYFEGKHGALPIGKAIAGLQYATRHKSVNESQFYHRLDLLKQMNSKFYSKYQHQLVKGYADAYSNAVKLMNSDDLKAFDIKLEKPQVLAAYGEGDFANGCLQARRLVEKGVRFVEVHSGGWDHHNNLYDEFAKKSQQIDQPIAMLLQDLEQRGLLESTLVVLATEFGRSPEINSNGGRNHYPKAFSGLMAGGGIKGGQAYGKTDESGQNIIKKRVKVPDFNATIAHAIGLDVNKEIFSPSGRPFKVADRGRPILDLF